MSEIVRLIESIKEIWYDVNEKNLQSVKNQITIMKKTDMPTLLISHHAL